jgi:hypothetical protein
LQTAADQEDAPLPRPRLYGGEVGLRNTAAAPADRAAHGRHEEIRAEDQRAVARGSPDAQ